MPWNSPEHSPNWNSTSGFDFNHITAVDMSFCTSVRNFIQIGQLSAEKMTPCRFSRRRISAISFLRKWRYCILAWRISAMLDFMGPILGSLESPCATSYRSSIDTVALSLVFEKIPCLHFRVKIQDGGSPPSWICGSQ